MSESIGTSLGDLVDLVADKTATKHPSKPYLGLEHIESRSSRLLGWASASDSMSVNCVFLREDVLFGKLRPRLRKCVQAPFDGYCSTDILVLRARPGVVPAYAFYQAASEATFRCAIRTEEGTRMPRTSWEAIRVVQYPTHCADEQRAIARVLGQIDTAIAQTERVIAKLKLIKAGLLHDLLTRGVDENGELRDPVAHPEQFWEVNGLGLVPRAWDIVTVGDLGTWQGGITPSKGKIRFWEDGHILWITPKDMMGGLLRDSQDKLTSLAVESHAMTVFSPESVIMVFRSGILRHSLPVAMCKMPFTVNQDMKVLTPNERVVSAYAFHLFRFLEWRVLHYAVKVGTTVESIDGDVFFRMPVARPSPDEQACIAERLHGLDGRLANQSAIVQKLRLLKQGLMHDLLTGQVRVPVESDETTAGDTAVDAPRSERKTNIYFMRSVLAAEIVEQMHEHATFGHVKFQKTLFLCERVAGLDLETRYHRAAAGPHDNRLMRSVDGQMEKQKWFRKVPRGIGTDGKPVGWAYERMENAGAHREWFEKYWAAARERIQRVIDMLRPLDTKRCEVVATLYSAWEDLLAEGREATDDAIVNEVLTNWHESKQAIPRETWIRALGWMRKQELQPATIGTR